ncbi:MAG: methyltransferase [Alphaproteobacteria bacterium]|nr:methyltransferase [Alphaproteobacteria bacterium]
MTNARSLPDIPEDSLSLYRDQAILGGRIMLRQMRCGYRVAVDSVLLAAAFNIGRDKIPPRQQHIVELGSGVGAGALCLAARLPELQITGYEIAAELVELAQYNAAQHNVSERVEFIQRDITAYRSSGNPRKFDHVIMNPPFHATSDTPSPDAARQLAFSLAEFQPWAEAARYYLRAGGSLTLIFRADGLAELLAALSPYFGSFAILPIAPRAEQPAKRIIIRAKLGGKSPLRLCAPLILHQMDSNKYTPLVEGILRDGAVLEF